MPAASTTPPATGAIPTPVATAWPATRVSSPRRVLAALSALGVAFASGACAGDTSETSRSDTYRGTISTLSVEFDDRGMRQVGVTHAAYRARIVGADRHDVLVERTLKHSEGIEADERIEQTGDALTITAGCPNDWVVGHAVCDARYEIKVPYGTNVRARGYNGDLTVRDTRGSVELTAVDGALVAGGGFAAVSARTTGEGSITLDGVDTPRIEARSGDGRVTVTAGREPAALTVVTGTGNIAITLPPHEPGYAVRATSRSGRTDSELPYSAGGPPVRVTSGEGTIKLRLSRH